MSTLKTHNLQSPDAGSVNIALAPNAGMVVAGISTFNAGVGIADSIFHTGDTDTVIRFPANNQIQFKTNDTERMIIGSSGNITLNNELRIPDAIAHVGDNDTKIRFPADDTVSVETGGSERLRITSDGKIGIGITNPIYDIQISGNYGIGKTSANGSYGNFVPYNGSTGNMEFNLNWPGGSTESMIFNIMGNERMRITSDGDILIGTNNKGISFANSSSSPDADSTSSTRVITDYDEGTCDWEIHRSDGLTTGSNTADTKVTYTKIGNRVYMSGYVYTASTGSSTSVTARLTDASGNDASLPYTPNHSGILPICHTRTISEYERMSVSFESGSKTVYVHTDEGFNSYNPSSNNVNITSAQTHLVIAFTGSYTTDE